MSNLKLVVLFALIFTVSVQSKPLSLQDEVQTALEKLQKVVEITIDRDSKKLSRIQQEFDVVMGGNVKSAFKLMQDIVREVNSRLNHMEITECIQNVIKFISRIPIIPTGDMFMCVADEEKLVNKLYQEGLVEVRRAQDQVQSIEDQVKQCDNSECLSKLLEEIQKQTSKLPTDTNVKTNAYVKKIENTQSNMIVCTSNTVRLVEIQVSSAEHSADKCQQ
ncbi:PREDICTED: uncharacterized protein LOC108561168 [Nicrophorus vespilloides]|uniref:Uncharacterized protein LOC108561168 n=1 Tax=Nicrophorus vespilloides TaxID=110193 RepID=A0ABM1MIS5_NICVS|nr:PREDICTED: uncharacterized protein LOC108561168 [Nicrophorus vespilloides]